MIVEFAELGVSTPFLKTQNIEQPIPRIGENLTFETAGGERRYEVMSITRKYSDRGILKRILVVTRFLH
jgi:hypothetical protein